MNLKIIALGLAVAVAPGVVFAQSGGGQGAGPQSINAPAGAYAVGAGNDGWDITQGVKSQGACASDSAACSLLERLSRIAVNLTTLNTTASTPPNSLASAGGDPCFASTKSNFAISTTAGTTALVTGVSAKKVYVCSFLVVAGGTAAASLIEGTNASCASPAAVVGSTTAASGIPLVANAGWQMGSGVGTVAQTATNANYLCLFQSSTVQLSGNVTYVVQ